MPPLQPKSVGFRGGRCGGGDRYVQDRRGRRFLQTKSVGFRVYRYGVRVVTSRNGTQAVPYVKIGGFSGLSVRSDGCYAMLRYDAPFGISLSVRCTDSPLGLRPFTSENV